MKIRRKFGLPTLLAIGALFLIGQANAIQIKMGDFDAGSSGNFRAKPLEEFSSLLEHYASGYSTDGVWFGTFCIEKNEQFTPGHTYDVGLNDGSIAGGRSGAVNGKDVISVGTAWIYGHFARGTLSDFGFVYGDRDHARQLQYTIWYLEGEVNFATSSHKYGSYLNLAMSQDNYAADYTGSSVKVMNLTSRNGTRRHQDQLVYVGNVPDGGATFAMLCIGLLGLVALKRKFGRFLD